MNEPSYYSACENCKHKLRMSLSSGIQTTCFYEMYLYINPSYEKDCDYVNEEEDNK